MKPMRKPKKISTINSKGMDGVPRHDMGIVTGEWKTKISREREGEMRIVRRREMTVEEDLRHSEQQTILSQPLCTFIKTSTNVPGHTSMEGNTTR